MAFKNPSHRSHYSSLEQPSFSESEQEKHLSEKQEKPELKIEDSKKEEPLEDTTEKDNARIGEIEKQIEESDVKHKSIYSHDGIGLMHEASKRNREDIKRTNASKRAKGEPVIQPEKESFLGKVKLFFEGKRW
jgi:hypothetical protein